MNPLVTRMVCLVVLAGPAHAASTSCGDDRGWRGVVCRLSLEHDGLLATLRAMQVNALERAEAVDAELARRVAAVDPSPLPRGYAALPEILPDVSPERVLPHEVRYSLEALEERIVAARHETAELSRSLPDLGAATVEAWVARFEAQWHDIRNLDEHLSYHDFWQGSAVEDVAFFADRNEIIERVREIQALRASGAQAGIAQRERQMLERAAPFVEAPGLEIRAAANAPRALAVTVHTDIDDQSFLGAFEDAVATHISRSRAARALEFTVELNFVRLDPAELYPGGAPAYQSANDLESHVARFPPGSLVLTTGTESTHAIQARYVALGPTPLTPRVLAHEFAHLLGFGDAYVRGYDGEPGAPYGVVLVEWHGLRDDLMGNPEGGEFTPEMVRALLEAYPER